MHILYLHQYFTTPDISSGTRSYAFAKKLIEKGHKVTMLTSSANIYKKYSITKRKINHINIDGINVISVRVDYSQKMSYRSRIKSFLSFMWHSSIYLLKKNDYDLVFATSTPLTIVIPGLVAKYRNKIAFIFEVRDLWPEYPVDFGIIKNRLLVKVLEKFCKFVYDKSDHIVAISNSMGNRIKSKYNIESEKLSVIPIGSWNHLKRSLDNSLVQKYINEFNLNSKFVIGYAGTIGYANNIDSILNMARALIDNEDIIFVIAGDGKEKARIEKKIQIENLKNIKLIGKFTQLEIINIVQMFDICYISGREYDTHGKKLMNSEDALSNKFFDYILMGKPILRNAKGEITNLMEQYGFGFYINDRDEKNIREVILKLKNDKVLRETMGRNALKVAEIYDRDKMALRLEKVFREVVS